MDSNKRTPPSLNFVEKSCLVEELVSVKMQVVKIQGSIQARISAFRGFYRREVLRASSTGGAGAAATAEGGRQSAAVTQNAAAAMAAAAAGTSSKKQKQLKLDLNPVRGTRDFFPEDHRLKDYIHGSWRRTSYLILCQSPSLLSLFLRDAWLCMSAPVSSLTHTNPLLVPNASPTSHIPPIFPHPIRHRHCQGIRLRGV